MKKKNNKVPMMMMMTSNLMILNANSWLFMWILMEMNSFAFSLILKNKKTPENSMLFFLIQTITAILFLMIYLSKTKLSNSLNKKIMSTMLFLTMMMKMGMFPLHLWMINMTKKISSKKNILLMSIQKIIPMKIMSKMKMNSTSMLILMSNMIISCIIMMYSKKMNQFFISSSMNHNSWMILSSMFSFKTSMMYLMMYSIPMMLMLKKENNYIMNQNQKTKNFVEEKMMNMFSLSGMPPSISFIMKMTILSMMMSQMKINLMIIIMMNLMLLFSFAYIKTVLNILTQKNMKKKKSKMKNKILIINMLMIMIMTLTL